MYWLVEEGGRDALRVRILELVDGRRVLPIFSFPEEAGLFAWRATRHRCGVRRTSPGEFTSLLGGVDLVALDPLSDAEGALLDGSVSLARDEFLGSFGRGIPAANQRARR